MQNNNLTNFFLGVIAVSLIIIVGMMAFGKGGVTKNEFHDDPVTRPLSGPAMGQDSTGQTGSVQSRPTNNSTVTSSVDSQTTTYTLSTVTVTPGSPDAGTVTLATSAPANFNGHYVVTTRRCGNSCYTLALYDKNTGKLYDFSATMKAGLDTEAEISDWFYSSASSNILSIRKKAANGSVYMEQWKMVDDVFVKI